MRQRYRSAKGCVSCAQTEIDLKKSRARVPAQANGRRESAPEMEIAQELLRMNSYEAPRLR